MPSPSIESITIEPASQAHLPFSIDQWLAAMVLHRAAIARGAARSAAPRWGGRNGAAHALPITGNWKPGAVITGNYTCNYMAVITEANYR